RPGIMGNDRPSSLRDERGADDLPDVGRHADQLDFNIRCPESHHGNVDKIGAMPAILIEELTKDSSVGFWRPRPYRALDRLSLSIEPGEVFGFLGPNGAGKATTMKLLIELMYPTSGRAEILGKPVGDVGVKRR